MTPSVPDLVPPSPSRDAPPIVVLRRLLDHLLQGYRALRDRASGGAIAPEEIAARCTSLSLAAAVLRDLDAGGAQPDRPSQVAVVGPTQVGKSTVVNLLLGQDVAEVSPLAGFTVHPHGFALAVEDDGWLAGRFAGWRRCAADELSPDRFDQYALTHLDAKAGALPPGTVAWDTPDFDSLAAGPYRNGVLEVAALAEVIVLVLSQEKYADLAVWEMVALIEPLGRPLVVCLNKMTPEAETAITAALGARFTAGYGDCAAVEVVALPRAAADLPAEPVARLQGAVARLLARAEATDRTAGARRLLRRHWPTWTTPVAAEEAGRTEWRRQVAAGVEEALAAYRRDYLDHPQRFDTFRRAMVELLYLLEIPGVARTLGRVRRLLTWPARRLFGGSRRPRRGGDEEGEVAVLAAVVDRLLTTLAREAAREADRESASTPFWRALSGALAATRTAFCDQFAAAARGHHEAFRLEIEAAAGRLHASLQKRPVLLTSLRAARVTTDAAAVAVAVKTGGLGMSDLLVAPAMLSLTSYLTEGALGTYLSQVAKELKERQYAAVEGVLFRNLVEPALVGLGDGLQGKGLFGIGAEELGAAEAAMEGMQRG